MLTVMVFALGSVSGAHFNPAVSLAITLRGKMPVDLMFLYSIILIYVVLNVATIDVQTQYSGLAVGFTVVAAAVAIGSVSGCSLNPAVSVGTLFVAAARHGFSETKFWALYTLTPFLAALVA